MLAHVAERASELSRVYGNVSAASVGAIQRRCSCWSARAATLLRRTGARHPRPDAHHPDGRGIVNVLAADKLMSSPRLYATFLLWLLSELFEELPEVGDPDKPRWCSSSTRRTCSSTRRPRPADRKGGTGGAADPLQGRRRLFRHAEPARRAGQVLAQLGNRVQHALRAFTPRDQKAVRRRPRPSARTRISTPSR
jgi:hypothetical protein